MAEGGNRTPPPHRGTIRKVCGEKENKDSDIKEKPPKSDIDQTEIRTRASRSKLTKTEQKNPIKWHSQVNSDSGEANGSELKQPEAGLAKAIDSLEGCNKTSRRDQDETNACAEKTKGEIVDKDQNQNAQAEKDEEACKTVPGQCPGAMLENTKTGCEGAYGVSDLKASTSLSVTAVHNNPVVARMSADSLQANSRPPVLHQTAWGPERSGGALTNESDVSHRSKDNDIAPRFDSTDRGKFSGRDNPQVGGSTTLTSSLSGKFGEGLTSGNTSTRPDDTGEQAVNSVVLSRERSVARPPETHSAEDPHKDESKGDARGIPSAGKDGGAISSSLTSDDPRAEPLTSTSGNKSSETTKDCMGRDNNSVSQVAGVGVGSASSVGEEPQNLSSSSSQASADQLNPTENTEQGGGAENQTDDRVEPLLPRGSHRPSQTNADWAHSNAGGDAEQESSTIHTTVETLPTTAAQCSAVPFLGTSPIPLPTATVPPDLQEGLANLISPEQMAPSEVSRVVSTSSSAVSSAVSETAFGQRVSQRPSARDQSLNAAVLGVRNGFVAVNDTVPVPDCQYFCVDLRRGQEDRTDHRDLPVTSTDQGGRRGEIVGVSDVRRHPEEEQVEGQRAEGDFALQLEQLDSTNPRVSDLIRAFGWGNHSAGQNGRRQQNAGNHPCLRCRQRPANVMTFNCHHQTLCHECVHQVEDCPWCNLPIAAFCVLDL